MTGLLSVIYDNYNDDDEDYSRLILKQNQSTCIPKRNILLEDEGYAFLQTSDIRELKTDNIVQQHQSLPSFATFENPISTGFKPLTRCLSDNNMIYLKPLLPSSVVFLKEQKIQDDNKRPSETAADNIEDLFVSPQNDCT